MSTARRKIESRIKKKEQEIQDLEAQCRSLGEQLKNHESMVREARASLAAFQESLDLIPDGEGGTPTLRPGSRLAKARDAIRASGKSLQIMDLLRAMGLEPTTQNRASMAGSISAYVRRGEIFTRPEANTFGLVELEDAQAQGEVAEEDDL